MKRNIKFDDQGMELVLDFNTDPEGGGSWRQVGTTLAKQMKTKLQIGKASAVSDHELDALLDGGHAS